jgi:hypothetical protein
VARFHAVVALDTSSVRTLMRPSGVEEFRPTCRLIRLTRATSFQNVGLKPSSLRSSRMPVLIPATNSAA